MAHILKKGVCCQRAPVYGAGRWVNGTLFDAHEVQQALEEYYGRKLQGRESIRVSDVIYIREGIAHYMYSFHLEYVEKAAKYSENLIIRTGRDKDELRKEFEALGKIVKTHGAHEIGVKEEAEMLINPAVVAKRHGADMDFLGRCAEFIEEKTGIEAPLLT